jgi:hypothetical protein
VHAHGMSIGRHDLHDAARADRADGAGIQARLDAGDGPQLQRFQPVGLGGVMPAASKMVLNRSIPSFVLFEWDARYQPGHQ